MTTTEISIREVREHKTRQSLWMVINNNVYDVTDFLDEHPPGEEPLLENAGTDATQAFNDVGHSDDARELLKKYQIGILASQDQENTICLNKENPICLNSKRSKASIVAQCSSCAFGRKRKSVSPPPPPPPSEGGYLKWVILALAGALVVGFAVKKYAS